MREIVISEDRNFKGVWTDREIYTDNNLTRTEKDALVEIISLCSQGQCFASNKHFAEYLGVAKGTAANVICSLRKKGYVSIELIYKNNSKEIDKRIITYLDPYSRKNEYPYSLKNEYPIHEKVKDKNTSKEYNNNKDNKESFPTETLVCMLPQDYEENGSQWHWKNVKTYYDYINKILVKYLWNISTSYNKNADDKQKFVDFWEKVFKGYFQCYRLRMGNLHPWYTEKSLKRVIDTLYAWGMNEERKPNSVNINTFNEYVEQFFSHEHLGSDYNMLVFANKNMLDVLYAEMVGGMDEYMACGLC